MLWLDDIRPAPDGWAQARSVNEAKGIVLAQSEVGDPVTHMSLDHDLGDYAHDGGDGTRFTDWLAEHDLWPDAIRIHSSNPVGIDAMLSTVDRYSHLPGGHSITRGPAPVGDWPPPLA